MATNSNVFSQGGGGTAFENEVQTAFFFNFAIGLNIPGAVGLIDYYRLQSGSLGYKTDDLLLRLNSTVTPTRILIQIKHNLIISPKGEEFIKVICDAWSDYRNASLFNANTDKIFIVKAGLTLDERNHLKVLLDWARAKADVDDFMQEAGRIKAKDRYLTMFKIILTTAFPDEYSHSRLFHFLKTLFFLEYDLDTENSFIKASFLSLISKYKTNDQISASQIWDSAKAFISSHNAKGGQFDKQNIPQEFAEAFLRVDAQAALRRLELLSTQSLEITEMIQDEIGGYSLPRNDMTMEMVEMLNENKYLIISGDPGCGKSALAKSFVHQIRKQSDGFILCFNAEELGSGHLRDYFIRSQLYLTVKELFGFFTLFPTNLIYIDAAEKLLEANGTPLMELMSAIREVTNVRVIISCRSSSLSLIELKYFNNASIGKLLLLPFTDAELDQVIAKVPALERLVQNKRLKNLLSYPKYLDFAYRAVTQTQHDFGDIDEEKFREQLWVIIIENKLNEYHSGLAERRSQIFIEIAVTRSKQMHRYAAIKSTDYETIERLIKDNVVLESQQRNLYAPAHDVLEDWALVRFVGSLYGRQLDFDSFFKELGNEPAMRRAYRLWVQSSLALKSEGPLNFAAKYLFQTKEKDYWKDESLVGILYSEHCHVFFDRFADKLQEDDFNAFFSLVQVMRTACRENIGNFNEKNYVPRGYGWRPVFRIIQENIAIINARHYDLLYQIIKDWSYIIPLQDELPSETRDVGLTLLFLFEKHFDFENRIDRRVDEAVELLCLLVGGLTPEFRELLQISKEQDSGNEIDEEDTWLSESLKGRVYKIALNGPHSAQLAKYLPEELLLLLRQHWLLTMEPVHYPQTEQDRFLYSISRHSSLDINHYFGLKSQFGLDYSPGSAYQTPILALLKYHTAITLDFVIELVNWCTENYRYSEFSKDDNPQDIQLVLQDGIKVSQLGNSYLWSIFRGKAKVAPYILQSVLMALERFLMDLFAKGGDAVVLANGIINSLYQKSTSVATTGVISSVCQAYPEHAGANIVPLLSSRNLITWDIQRYSHDGIHKHLRFFEPYFDDERVASDELPHRTRYYGGLRGFFPLYCYQYGYYNERIFSIIDEYRREADMDDFEWRKTLDEIDIRTWRVTDTIETGETVSYQVEPSYNDGIKQFVTDLRNQADAKNENDAYLSWLWKVHKKEIEPTFDKWQDTYDYYKKIDKFSFLDHQPGKVAGIGVCSFWKELQPDQKDWCLEIIVGIIQTKIRSAYERFNIDMARSSLNNDSALSAFPVLLGYDDLPDRQQFELIALQFLTSPFQESDPDTMHFYLSIGNNLWSRNEGLSNKLLNGLLLFAGFTKKNRLPSFFNGTEEQKKNYWHKYEQLLIKGITEGYVFDIGHLNFAEYSIHYVTRAIRTLPVETESAIVFELLAKAYLLYIPILQKEGKRDRDDENFNFGHYLGSLLQDRISKMILWNDHVLGKNLFTDFLRGGQQTLRTMIEKNSRKIPEVARFFRQTIENIILEADRTLPENDSTICQKTADRFIAAWKVFAAYMLKPDSLILFADHLLLDIDVQWRKEATNWQPLTAGIEFYQTILQTFGPVKMDSTIVFLSHIGDKLFLFRNLGWLISLLKNPKIGADTKKYKSLEQLVVRVYQNHLDELLANNELFGEYLWLLDNLIAQQSSDAYWIREFIFSFKK